MVYVSQALVKTECWLAPTVKQTLVLVQKYYEFSVFIYGRSLLAETGHKEFMLAVKRSW